MGKLLTAIPTECDLILAVGISSQNKHSALHGTMVGVATLVVRELYDKCLHGKLDFDEAKRKAKAFEIKEWERGVIEAYGEELGTRVAELEEKVGKNDPKNVLGRIRTIRDKWPELVRVAEEELPEGHPQPIWLVPTVV